MPRLAKSTCQLCDGEFADIESHIYECLNTIINKKATANVVLKITDTKKFWLYVLVPVDFTLEDLDEFLRDTWMECCGHLSRFIIDGKYFDKPKMKKCKMKDLNLGMDFLYEYDMGDTTELSINIFALLGIKNKKIKIISQNNDPPFKCLLCKKFNSNKLCFGCGDTFCDKCSTSKKHKCDIERMFDLINSPRFAYCFYASSNMESSESE